MANRTFTSDVYNYNYNKDDAYAVMEQEERWFDLDAFSAAKDYIRVIVRTSKTVFNNVGKTVYITRTNPTKPRKITIDDARLVILGGPFEQIGGKDESVGGGNQKVGQANK